MEDVIASIKEMALIIKPDLADAEESPYTPLLDLVTGSVVDRFLIYTNRDQFVEAWEDAVEDLEEDEELDTSLLIDVPVPERAYSILANAVVGAYRTINERSSAETGAVKSLEDNGQSISYSEKLTSFLSSGGDSEIFADSIEVLNNFRVGDVVEPAY